ncbi:unnamed protein product [Dicrocoelium dendriticum]|nr:unnamed protein product [Dicrocoelium dendriticum]
MKNDEELIRLIAAYPIQAKAFLTNLRRNGQRRACDVANQVAISDLRTVDAGFNWTSRVVNPNNDVPAPFCAETTYNRFFGYADRTFRWAQPVLRFGETPVFTDSLLYPTQQRRLRSTTHEAFAPKQVSSVDLG